MAVDVGESLAAGAAELTRALQARVAAQAPGAKVTWIPAERLHLTVRFIGEVDDRQADAVLDALAAPLAIPPFQLTLAGAGAFPKSGSPRVLWLGVTQGREPLQAAERTISARLAALGIPEEERPYSPHLTLARVREPARLRSAHLLEGLGDWAAGTVCIDAITLFHSRLSPKGPTYTPLVRTRLAGSENLSLH